MVRCFESGDVVHVSGRVSPLDDIDTVETELLLADLEQAVRARDRVAKAAKAGGKQARAREALMARAHAHLAEGRMRSLEAGAEEASVLATLSPLTAKPVLYVANVAEDGFGPNPPAEAVEARARAEGAEAVRVRHHRPLQGRHHHPRACLSICSGRRPDARSERQRHLPRIPASDSRIARGHPTAIAYPHPAGVDPASAMAM